MKKVVYVLLLIILIISIILSGCDFTQEENLNPSDTTTQEESPASSNFAVQDGIGVLTDEKLLAIQEKFDTRITQTGFRGIVYAVYNDAIVYEKGTAKANKKEDIDVNTVFEIGSITKQFTAAAILLLQEQGKLSVSDTIDRYFFDYEYGKDITIHHLLSMQSGIIDCSNKYGEDDIGAYTDDEVPFKVSAENSGKENRKIIEEWFMSQPLRFAPGERYEYSSSGYILLGEIIEQISGMTYQEFIQENIFDPLKMTSSGFLDTWDKGVQNVACPYNKEYYYEWHNYPGVKFAMADIMSSASDLYKWAEGLINYDILSKESLNVMITNYCTDSDQVNYGYGVKISDDGTIIYHGGHIPSFYSVLSFSPYCDYVQILLSNYSYEYITLLSENMSNDFYKTLNNIEENQ